MPIDKVQASINGKKSKGVPKRKTRDWNDIGDFILKKGSAKFVEALEDQCENDQKQYIETFLKTLEYFKPKLARQELTGKGGEELKIFLKDNSNK